MRIIKSLDLYSFFILLFSLPFGKSLFTPILFLWLTITLISYFIKGDYSINQFRSPLILLVLFYLLYALSVMLSSPLKEGFSELIFKLPLLLLPVLYPSKRETYKNSNSKFFVSFISGCVIASIFYFSYALYRSYSLVENNWVFNPVPKYGWNNNFLSSELSVLIHPSYFALFLLVSLLIISVSGKNLWSKELKIKIAIILTLAIFVISLFMLQSRAGLLGFGGLVLTWIYYIVFVKRKYFIGLVFLIGIITVFFFSFQIFDRFSNTVKSVEKTITSGISDKDKEDGNSVRFWIWKSALTVIEEHPFWGIGPKNVKETLNKEYIRRGMDGASVLKLNAHNQYLETWLGVGVIGFISLLAMLFVPLWLGIKYRDWLLVGFICLCSTSFMFESMLERTAGIAFFAIFYTIFASQYLEIKVDSVSERN